MPAGKIRTILVLYSLAVTLLLLLAAFLFIRTAAPPAADLPDVFITASGQQFLQTFRLGGVNAAFGATAVTSADIRDYCLQAMYRYFPIILAAIFTIVTAGAWFLWKALNRQSERHAQNIAKDLRNIGGMDAPAGRHPAIQESYSEIKGRMDAYVSDYIRLSNYITHEQKNILALLRAKLQLSGNAALVAEVDRVTASINDVLTLSASGGMRREEVIDAALVCAGACDDYRKVYPGIRFRFDDDGCYRIRAREMWVSRAVCNLLDNAIKYGEGSPVDVSVKSRKGSVVIAVADRGRGIDEESQEKLFDSRFRLSGINKDGYGIGLNLVKHVCALCGGFAWVESAVGRGSTFYLVFPQALTAD